METVGKASVDDLDEVGYREPQTLPTDQKPPVVRQHSANDSGIEDVNGASRHSSRVCLSAPRDSSRGWNSNNHESEECKPTVNICHDSRGTNNQCHGRVQRLLLIHPKANGSNAEEPVKYNVTGTNQHDYEDLPNANIDPEESVAYTSIDDCSVTDGNAPFSVNGEVTIADSKQQLVFQGMEIVAKARRRDNPLYVKPDPYARQYSSKNHEPCSGTCCCGFQTVGFLLSIVALVLAIISMINGMTGRYPNNSTYDDLSRKYQDLTTKYSALYEAMQNGSGNRVWIDGDTDRNNFQTLLYNNSQLLRMINQLRTQDMNISQSIDELSIDLIYRMNQMLHGLTNMSQCRHQWRSHGVSANLPISYSDPMDLSNYTVLGVTCSTDGGSQALLLGSSSDSPNVYQCECRGKSGNSTSSRFCTIHYWICPLVL